MNEKLPKKYNQTLFCKIFNILKKYILKLKEKNKDNPIPSVETIQEKNMDYLKFEINVNNTDFAKNEFMKNLSNNPDLLHNFSVDRLEKILEYYKKENEKKRELLKKLSV